MKNLPLTLLVLLLSVALSGNAAAEVPAQVPIQGVLTDTAGAPVNGSVTMTFALYDAPQAETALWSDDFSLELVDGFYTVYLGSQKVLDPLSLIAGPDVWLGITVADDSEMDRIQLASVVFALQAQVCEQIGSLTATDIQPVLSGDRACALGSFVRGWDDVTGQTICASDERGVSTESDPVWTSEKDAYCTLAELESDSSIKVHWSNLDQVPPGFADGQDDGLTAESDPVWTAASGPLQSDIQANTNAITTINQRQRLSATQTGALEIQSYGSDQASGLSLSIQGRGRDVLTTASINVDNTVSASPHDTQLVITLRFNDIFRLSQTVVLKGDSRQVVHLQWLERTLATATHTVDITVNATNRVDLKNRSLYLIEL